MNNLYRIIDKDGNDLRFTMNSVQEDVFDNLHNRNLILKARQLGMCLDPDTKVLKVLLKEKEKPIELLLIMEKH